MGCLLIHLTTVGILITQHVASKLDNHHLHPQADTESGDIMGAGIFGSNNLSFYTTIAEAWTNHDASNASKFLCHILLGNLLAVDEMKFCLYIIIYTSEV